jgi:hypothetical protein
MVVSFVSFYVDKMQSFQLAELIGYTAISLVVGDCDL